jgi:microcystin-dependent protein
MRRRLILSAIALFLVAIPAHAQQPFVGQIDIVGFNFAPQGWAFCDGSLMAISNNPTLFTLIGTTYGGDGQNTFALPDLRGRMAIHQGAGLGQDYVMGQKEGEEQVTLTLNQMPIHSHTVSGSSAKADSLGPGLAEWASTTVFLYSSTGPNPANPAAMKSAAIGAMGGGQPFENLPPYLAVNFIISLFGVFPSQQ